MISDKCQFFQLLVAGRAEGLEPPNLLSENCRKGYHGRESHRPINITHCEGLGEGPPWYYGRYTFNRVRQISTPLFPKEGMLLTGDYGIIGNKSLKLRCLAKASLLLLILSDSWMLCPLQN